MTDDFLPEFKPRKTHVDNTLQCQIRNKAVPYTPEEEVRQRVLHWLICNKEWPKDEPVFALTSNFSLEIKLRSSLSASDPTSR